MRIIFAAFMIAATCASAAAQSATATGSSAPPPASAGTNHLKNGQPTPPVNSQSNTTQTGLRVGTPVTSSQDEIRIKRNK
jgi:hypothetical protein